MAKKNTAMSYIKNVGKSFGYSFIDVMKENNSVLVSLAKETKETTSEIYQTVKDFKLGAEDSEKTLLEDSKDAIGSLWKNLKDDLKTGNWYNKERDKEAEAAMAKAMGFDLSDFDVDFNLDDDWGDEDDDFTPGEEAQVEQGVKNTAATIMAMGENGKQIASTVNRGTAESANYVVQASRQMNAALFDLNKKGFTQVTEALMNVNTTTAKFADAIGAPLTTHINNSQVFFTNVTQSLQNIEETLKNIEKNTSTGAPLAANNKTGSHMGLGALLDGEGFSVSAYKDMVKKNLGNYKDMVSMFTGGIRNAGGLNAAAKTISPMKFMTTHIITLMLPKMLTESMKDFNSSLTNLITGALTKRSNGASSGILSFLEDILLPENRLKKTLNTEAYNKGAIAWDGIARKALIEVIPTTLFKIYSAITGSDEMSYNYETGKFTTVKSIQKDVKQSYQRAANNAAYEYRDKARQGMAKSVQDEMDSYFLHAFMTGDPSKLVGMDENGKEVKLSATTKARLKQVRKTKENGRTKYKYDNYATEIAMARQSYTDNMYRNEASGHHIETILHNDSNKMTTTSKLYDKDYNAKVVYYLEGIYQNTFYGGGSGDGSGRRKGRPILFEESSRKKAAAIRGSEAAKEKTKAEANRGIRKNRHETEEEREKKHKEEIANKLKDDLQTYEEKFSGKTNSIKDKMYNFMMKTSPELMLFLKAPIDAFAGFVEKFTKNVNEFLWGRKGIFEFVKDKFKNKFPKLKESLNNFWKDTKSTFGDIGKSLGGTTKQILGIHGKSNKRYSEEGDPENTYRDSLGRLHDATTGKWIADPKKKKKQEEEDGIIAATGIGEAEEIDTAYGGRRVTKTGIIAVSEGELIIPSEFNPFFKGRTNKKQQMRNENEAIRRFYGAFTDGGQPIAETKEPKTKKSKKSKTKKNDDEPSPEEFKGLLDYLKDFKDEVKAGFGKAKDKVKDSEFDKKFKASMKDAFQKEDLLNARGAMGAGGIIGLVGGSLFAGSPILGAIAGTTIGYVVKSEKAQNWLFGELDEKGNRTGGVFGKEFSNFATKHFPAIGKGAALGFLGGGLLAGSPILGAIAGSAIGWVASSTRAKEALFGKEVTDENGNKQWKEGIISKKLQEQIKKAAPRMAAGALAGGLIGGPFGVVGGALIGSTVGFASTTEKFHDFFFGDGKDKEGLLPKIQKKIIGNITELFANMGNRLKHIGAHLFNRAGRAIKFITGKIADYFDPENDKKKGFFGKFVAWTGRQVGRLIKLPFSLTGGALGLMSKHTKRRNLRQNMDVYDKNLGRNLTAKERMQLRGSLGKTLFRKQAAGTNELDQALANIETQKDLENVQSYFEGAKMGDADSVAKLKEWDKESGAGLFKENGKLNYKKLVDANLLLKTEAKHRTFKSPVDVAAEQNVKNTDDIKEKVSIISTLLKKIAGAPMDPEEAKKAFGSQYDKKSKKKKKKKGKKGKSSESSLMDQEDDNETGSGAAQADQDTDEEDEAASRIVSAINKASSDLDDKEGVQSHLIGHHVVETKKTKDGSVEFNMQDAKTAQGLREMEETDEATRNMPKSIGLLGGTLGGVFSKIGDAIFGKKDEPSAFSKAFSWIKENLLLIIAGIAGFKALVDGKLGEILTKVGGTINKVLYKLTGGAYGDQEKEAVYTSKDGREVYTDENGVERYVDNGQISDMTIERQGPDSATTRIKKAAINEVPRRLINYGVKQSVKSGVSNTLEKVAAKSAAKSVAKEASKGALKAAEDAVEDLVTNQKAVSGIAKFFKKIFKKEMTQELAEKAAKEVVEKTAKAAGKSAVKSALGAVVWVLVVAEAVWEFHEGYQDARTMLRITSSPTTSQKILCGVCRAIKNVLIPLGSAIPDSLMMDILVPILGACKLIDAEEIKQKRTEAQTEVDEYNLKNGTNYTVQEYNKAVLHDYTWGEELDMWFKGLTSSEIKEQNKARKAEKAFTKLTGYDFTNKSSGGGGRGNTKQEIAIILHSKYWNAYYRAYMIDSPKIKTIEKLIKEDKKALESGDDIDETEYTESSSNSEYNTKQASKNYYQATKTGNANDIENAINNAISTVTNDPSAQIKTSFPNQTTVLAISTVDNQASKNTLKNSGIYTTTQTISAPSSGSTFIPFNSGGASGIISQYDSRYQNMTVGGKSFASKGCGPAVAAMAAQAAGKNLSVQEAVDASKPYQNANGVTSDYFTNVLGSRGISTSYATSYDQIARAVAGGNTILLGSDPNNNSKVNSPFGPNGHYVLATGVDSNGNILIKDPESNTIRAYDKSILRSAKLGILAGGGTIPDTDVARSVWGFLTSRGFSPAAAAGIMGNLYQESWMKPETIQRGSGHAAGIAQWESYKNKAGRWLNLYNFAKNRGKDWTDLDSQLEFLLSEFNGMGKRVSGEVAKSNIDKVNNLSGWNLPTGITMDQFKSTDDLRLSTGLFEAAFERAGKPNMEGRYNNALAYYNMYNGSPYTKSYAPITTSGTNNDENITGAESPQEDKITYGNILSKIKNAIFGRFGLGSTDTTSSTNITSSNATGGITSDPAGFDFGSAQTPIDYMRAVKGKVMYSMKGHRNPEKGDADCSSTVRWAIEKAGGPFIGRATAGQYNNENLETVWYDNGNVYKDTQLPSNLKPNDILFFRRNGDWNVNYPDRVGHVGLYTGDGNFIHQPGPEGKYGPIEQKVNLANKDLIKIARLKAAGSGSGLAPHRFIGGDSAINNLKSQTTTMLTDISRSVAAAGNNGSLSPELVQQLIMAIIEILKSIANNTAPIGQIYTAVNNFNNATKQTKQSTTSTVSETPKYGSEENFNKAIQTLSSQINAIAAKG